ncbi:hypothetical protein [Agrococcus sp. ARC_14]|uniref:hypothetical protein n=1 Tax=Agrococcus sp. ARC_14 TaxID=2919927 RepID=UPI001F05535E|nr:hypothetical protein [Agrococcus sp. ARC_14]MCH1884071.1 hypothetical protein [Agrococcus sp. ARC_14]
MIITMEPNWFSVVPMDPTWIAVLGALGALGLIATVVMLVRQSSPRTRVDRDRVARRRETGSPLAL